MTTSKKINVINENFSSIVSKKIEIISKNKSSRKRLKKIIQEMKNAKKETYHVEFENMKRECVTSISRLVNLISRLSIVTKTRTEQKLMKRRFISSNVIIQISDTLV